MSWFRVDDGSAFHRKIVRAGNEAWGAVCRGGAWSANPSNATDGFVPEEVAALIAPESVWSKAEECGVLGGVGLVSRVDGGWQIHDYLEWNPSADEVEQRRAEIHARRSKAGMAGNASRWNRRSKHIAESQTVSQTVSQTIAPSGSHPDPIVKDQITDHVKDAQPNGSHTTGVRGVRSQAVEVLEHWRDTLAPGSLITEPRIAKVVARIREGYTVEQLKLVPVGASKNPWNCGDNPNGKKYFGVDNIFGSADKVDRHIASATSEEVEEFDGWKEPPPPPDDPPGTVYSPPPQDLVALLDTTLAQKGVN